MHALHCGTIKTHVQIAEGEEVEQWGGAVLGGSASAYEWEWSQ